MRDEISSLPIPLPVSRACRRLLLCPYFNVQVSGDLTDIFGESIRRQKLLTFNTERIPFTNVNLCLLRISTDDGIKECRLFTRDLRLSGRFSSSKQFSN